MSQTALDLLHPAPEAGSADPVIRTGFQVGWDHARHGLVPPAELLLEGTPVAQGWMAARAVFGARTLAATRPVRLWLQLRTTAWRQGVGFDDLQVTPHYLAQIHTERCPVLRQPLGGAAGSPLAAVVERLNPQAGFAAGNLAIMSQAAATARRGLAVLDLVRRARQAELVGDTVSGLDAPAWWRLAALAAFALPALPFADATRLPLALMPPNRVRVLNAAQGLQALVTQLFLRPGWSARARALGAMLPAHTLRHDFNLFVGAMAPRVLEAGTDPATLRSALEDAWCQERVQRRWQHFVLALGETACETLLEQAARAGLAGIPVLTHPAEQAVDGWGLPQAVAPAQAKAGAFTAPRPPKNRSATTGARLS
jgi:hypothetical protein